MSQENISSGTTQAEQNIFLSNIKHKFTKINLLNNVVWPKLILISKGDNDHTLSIFVNIIKGCVFCDL